jgi:hypothetical protein
LTSSITKILFLSVILVLCLFNASAQTDTEFWFAAPEVSTGSSLFDRSIYIRISTLQHASEVTISQPANSNFTPILVNIGANTTRTINLTGYIETIENKPANRILNYGLLITASTPVSAYYEVASTNCNCNPEIFSLKGRNALGTLFYTPFQNLWDNSYLVSYSPTPYSSFDIIATENATSVTITPKNDLVGHLAGISFTVILDKGQTYSATALSQLANKHLGGSKISADKPVAVTIKDDLLYVPGQNSSMLGIDLIGDQIVPVNIIGNEYIVTKGRLFTNEKAFILATQDATAIYVDGNILPVATINTGTTFTLNISNPNTYIKTNNPVYVLHTSGYEYELGAALLPKLECNGSSQIGFTRSNSQVFALSLVVRKGGEAGFVINGNPNIISPNNFSVVSGTGGEWMSAQIQLSTATIPVNVASLLSNSISVFQMGIIDGNDGGASYSYTSDFNNPTVYLGSDKSICSGDLIVLDAGPNKTSYTWNDGSKKQTLQVLKGGKYWVTTSIGGCISSDTIIITEESLPSVDLGSDKTICSGQSIVLDVAHAGATYKWQDGSTNSSFEVKSAGTYWVEASNKCGTVRDEIIVTQQALPSINLGDDIILCKQQSITLDASNAGATYKWQDGSTLPTFTTDKAGVYWVEVSNRCGTVRDEITITEEEKLKQQVSALHIEKAVKFAGAIYDSETLGKYFMSASVYVLAGMGGLSINEAMSFDRPVVCSECDGTEKKLVREGYNGRYFEDGSAESLYEVLKNMLAHPEDLQEMGIRSGKIIQNEVNIHTVINGYIEAFNFVTNNKYGLHYPSTS